MKKATSNSRKKKHSFKLPKDSSTNRELVLKYFPPTRTESLSCERVSRLDIVYHIFIYPQISK